MLKLGGGGVVKAAPTAMSGGLLTKAQLCEKLGTKPSEKEKGSEDVEGIARWQEIVYRDASGRKKRDGKELCWRRRDARDSEETRGRCRAQRGTEDKGVVK